MPNEKVNRQNYELHVLFIYLFTYLFIYLFIYLFTYLFVYLFADCLVALTSTILTAKIFCRRIFLKWTKYVQY